MDDIPVHIVRATWCYGAASSSGRAPMWRCRLGRRSFPGLPYFRRVLPRLWSGPVGWLQWRVVLWGCDSGQAHEDGSYGGSRLIFSTRVFFSRRMYRRARASLSHRYRRWVCGDLHSLSASSEQLSFNTFPLRQLASMIEYSFPNPVPIL
ncbi:hypothetical protein, unlikely [Trypanosoma congolense IL3000]|uniref:Uncharacterized protein n=1 Tax=Trypanosoma congolense (strain IL3000) TaxID=1068625 RepID=F9W815_TRYCI|nr:hypothetical protein, unlikely [Trypanosoma congolense IL3000]